MTFESTVVQGLEVSAAFDGCLVNNAVNTVCDNAILTAANPTIWNTHCLFDGLFPFLPMLALWVVIVFYVSSCRSGCRYRLGQVDLLTFHDHASSLSAYNLTYIIIVQLKSSSMTLVATMPLCSQCHRLWCKAFP